MRHRPNSPNTGFLLRPAVNPCSEIYRANIAMPYIGEIGQVPTGGMEVNVDWERQEEGRRVA